MAAKFHSPTVIYWLYTDFIGRDCSDGVQSLKYGITKVLLYSTLISSFL